MQSRKIYVILTTTIITALTFLRKKRNQSPRIKRVTENLSGLLIKLLFSVSEISILVLHWSKNVGKSIGTRRQDDKDGGANTVHFL